ncbi:hypothetical protein PQX77_012263 [Marasmius sp. AFHP31]|nr:hypothetical protein PQX77_012263 [Marasmius sp. AFHP31]
MASEEEKAQRVMEPFTTVQQVIVQPTATLSMMFLVYGMYIIIFGTSLNVLWHRRESSASKAYMNWIIALFVLTAIHNATEAWINIDQTIVTFNAVKTNNYILLRSLFGGIPSPGWTARAALYAFSSAMMGCIFDYLMVHHCYIIWGYNKWILYPFGLVVVVANTINIVLTAITTAAYHHHDSPLYERSLNITDVITIVSAVYASLLTLLTAGRIWWTVRQVGRIAGSRVHTKYRIFVATILESGFLYSASQVISVVLPLITDPSSDGLAPVAFNAISVQMAAIAPTLIIIRIAYGQAVESVQQMVSTLHFVEGPNDSQHRSMATRGTVDLRQSLAGVEERGAVGRLETEKPPSNVVGDASGVHVIKALAQAQASSLRLSPGAQSSGLISLQAQALPSQAKLRAWESLINAPDLDRPSFNFNARNTEIVADELRPQ